MSTRKKRTCRLTPRQDRFCQEYIVDLNGSAAASRAGYSHKSRERLAGFLLRNPQVTARIAELQCASAQRVAVDADFVLGKIMSIASADLRTAFGADGKLLPIHEIPDQVAAALSGIDYRGKVLRIRTLDRLKALEMLGRHLALFRDVVEHRGLDEIATRLSAANRRLGAIVPGPPAGPPS